MSSEENSENNASTSQLQATQTQSLLPNGKNGLEQDFTNIYNPVKYKNLLSLQGYNIDESYAGHHVSCKCTYCLTKRPKEEMNLFDTTDEVTSVEFENHKALITEKLRDTDDQDFAFVLKRLHNNRNKIGNPMILVADTVLFENNEPILFVYNKKFNGIAKLNYRESSEEKPLRWLEIKRAMAEHYNQKNMSYHNKYVCFFPNKKNTEQQFKNNLNFMLPQSPTNQLKSNIQGWDSFQFEEPSHQPKKHNENSTILNERKSKVFNETSVFDYNHEQENSKTKFKKGTNCSSKNINRAKHLSTSKHNETVSFLDELRLIFKFKVDDRIEVIGKNELNTRIVKRNTTKIFKDYNYVQRAIYNNHANMNIYKVKFCKEHIEDEELFERAIIESRVLNDRCPKTSLFYISRDQEAYFMEELMREKVRCYCLYICYKIYHIINEFHEIQLEKFVADFVEDVSGAIYLSNVYLINIETKRKDLNQIMPTKNNIQSKGHIDDLVVNSITKHMGYKDTHQKSASDQQSILEKAQTVGSLGDIRACSHCGPKELFDVDAKSRVSKNNQDLEEGDKEINFKYKLFSAMNNAFQESKQELISNINSNDNNVYDKHAAEINNIFQMIHPKFAGNLTDVLAKPDYNFNDAKVNFWKSLYLKNTNIIQSLKPPKELQTYVKSKSDVLSGLKAQLDTKAHHKNLALGFANFYSDFKNQLNEEIIREGKVIQFFNKLVNNFDKDNSIGNARLPFDLIHQKKKFIEKFWTGNNKDSYLKNASSDLANELLETSFLSLDRKKKLDYNHPKIRNKFVPRDPIIPDTYEKRYPSAFKRKLAKHKPKNTIHQSFPLENLPKPTIIRSISKEEVNEINNKLNRLPGKGQAAYRLGLNVSNYRENTDRLNKSEYYQSNFSELKHPMINQYNTSQIKNIAAKTRSFVKTYAMNFNLEYKQNIRSKTLDTKGSTGHKYYKQTELDNNSYINQTFHASNSYQNEKTKKDDMLNNIIDSKIDKPQQSSREDIIKKELIDMSSSRGQSIELVNKKASKLYDEIFTVDKDMTKLYRLEKDIHSDNQETFKRLEKIIYYSNNKDDKKFVPPKEMKEQNDNSSREYDTELTAKGRKRFHNRINRFLDKAKEEIYQDLKNRTVYEENDDSDEISDKDKKGMTIQGSKKEEFDNTLHCSLRSLTEEKEMQKSIGKSSRKKSAAVTNEELIVRNLDYNKINDNNNLEISTIQNEDILQNSRTAGNVLFYDKDKRHEPNPTIENGQSKADFILSLMGRKEKQQGTDMGHEREDTCPVPLSQSDLRNEKNMTPYERADYIQNKTNKIQRLASKAAENAKYSNKTYTTLHSNKKDNEKTSKFFI